jgi:RsiW-degrading membrane proteinase PrsW (M82 family)
MTTLTPAAARAPSAQQRRAARLNDLLPIGDWLRHRSFRSWPVLLFLVLICAPVIALVVLGDNPTASTFEHVAWIFAAYFALAWLLLLGVIVRPEHVTKSMLLLVIVIALATQVPLAIALETALQSNTNSLAESIFTVAVPEELVKALPVVAIGLIFWRRRDLQPRDYLFLGAVSGLAFGAAEVVHYFTVNGVAQFYQVVQSSIPSINQLISNGNSPSASLFAVLIGPVRFFILEFVWRFVTDPISHACWAGLSGYFIGLAMTKRHSWYLVSWIGLAAAAVLHGLNDWGRVNGGPLWIVVVAVSGILVLGYAKVGSRGERQAVTDALPPAFRLHETPAEEALSAPQASSQAEQPAPASGRRPAGAYPGSGPLRPWWQH